MVLGTSMPRAVRAAETMMQRGLFIVKGGMECAAKVLGVARFAIYHCLDALKEGRRGHRDPVASAAPPQEQRNSQVLGVASGCTIRIHRPGWCEGC